MRIDSNEIKAASEAIVKQNGGQICDWLPHIEQTTLRNLNSVISRALILNAMLNIHFGAPTSIIKSWIEKHNLVEELSPVEVDILSRNKNKLSEQEIINLYWYIEALWSFLWATNMVESIGFTVSIPDSMASKCPNLQNNEGPEKFIKSMLLRDYETLYKERDLYYRVMWWGRQLHITGQEDPKFNLSRIMERRRSLEWIMDATLDWDDVPLNT